MDSKVDQIEEEFEVKRYQVQYPISAYTFPSEARIHRVDLDEEYLHLELTDGRKLSVPLWWIPTVYNASPEQRAAYAINRSRTMIIWEPEQSGINDELRIADYLGPCQGNE